MIRRIAAELVRWAVAGACVFALLFALTVATVILQDGPEPGSGYQTPSEASANARTDAAREQVATESGTRPSGGR